MQIQLNQLLTINPIGESQQKVFDAWAKEKNCSHLFVTATAELHEMEQRLFINLMKKYGLVERGPVLSLKME